MSQDHAEAMKWWTKAADNGSITALANIAATYFTGLGVPQSYPGGGQMVSVGSG